jgi:transposase
MMNKEQIFEMALGIDKPWYIKEIKFDLPNRQLDIYIDFQKGSRFYYEDEEDKGHYAACGSEEKTWRHLNFFQHECYLHARVPSIEIKYNKTRLVRTPWEGESKGFTLLFEALLLGLCSQMPVLAVSRIVNESDDKLWRMLDKYISEARELIDFSGVKSVGMDEKSIRKDMNTSPCLLTLKKRKQFL